MRPNKENRNERISSILLVITGISLICAGIYRGEAQMVFMKAIRLCLECAGFQ